MRQRYCATPGSSSPTSDGRADFWTAATAAALAPDTAAGGITITMIDTLLITGGGEYQPFSPSAISPSAHQPIELQPATAVQAAHQLGIRISQQRPRHPSRPRIALLCEH